MGKLYYSLPGHCVMTFEAFQRHLSTDHRSASTGRPFGQHAAGDYPSRLRRMELLLQTSLENAPPMILRSLANDLRGDPRVNARVSRKVMGDLARALREYASALRKVIMELQNAALLNSPIAPEKNIGDAMRTAETEATVLPKARVGQGRFRADLLTLWNGKCALTDVSVPELLRASHIKSWRESDNRERLDVFNGLLLTVHFDALFDRALISFQDSGDMLISKRLSVQHRDVFGITYSKRKLLLNISHLGYMRHHQDRFRSSEQKF